MTRLQESVYSATRRYLEEHRPEELQMFEVLWSAAKEHLAELVEGGSGLQRVFGGLIGATGKGGVTDPDEVSWMMLTAFACLFTWCPLEAQKPSDGSLQERIQQAVTRARMGHELAQHFTTVASLLYELPLASTTTIPAPEELYDVWVRERADEEPERRPTPWKKLEQLEASRRNYDLFVRLDKPTLYAGRGLVNGIQKRHKELLAHLLLNDGRPCTSAELLTAIWAKRPNLYRFARADSDKRRQRVDKSFRNLAALLSTAGVGDAVEKSGEMYMASRRVTFCVIPARPYVKLKE